MSTSIQLGSHPDHVYRVDNFSVPSASRVEFEAAMRRSIGYLEVLPGYLGHVALAKAGGGSKFNITTIAVWANMKALEAAAVEVRATHARIGFDLAAKLNEWGVVAERGNYIMPPRLQEKTLG